MPRQAGAFGSNREKVRSFQLLRPWPGEDPSGTRWSLGTRPWRRHTVWTRSPPLVASPLGGRAASCGTVPDPEAVLLLLPAGAWETNIVPGARGPLLITGNPVSQNQDGSDSLKLRAGRLRCNRNMAELTSTRPSPKDFPRHGMLLP